MTRWLLPLLMIVALAGGVEAGIWYTQQHDHLRETNSNASHRTTVEQLQNAVNARFRYAADPRTIIEAQHIDLTTWKTLTDKTFGFSVQYPPDWTAVDQSVDQDGTHYALYGFVPTSFLASWTKSSKGEKGDPIPHVYCFQGDGTSQQFVQGDVDNGNAIDVQDFPLLNGTTATFYLRRVLMDSENVIVAGQGLICDLSRAPIADSPLSKMQDELSTVVFGSFKLPTLVVPQPN